MYPNNKMKKKKKKYRLWPWFYITLQSWKLTQIPEDQIKFKSWVILKNKKLFNCCCCFPSQRKHYCFTRWSPRSHHPGCHVRQHAAMVYPQNAPKAIVTWQRCLPKTIWTPDLFSTGKSPSTWKSPVWFLPVSPWGIPASAAVIDRLEGCVAGNPAEEHPELCRTTELK